MIVVPILSYTGSEQLHTIDLRDVKLIYEASSETVETIMELMQLVVDGLFVSSSVFLLCSFFN